MSANRLLKRLKMPKIPKLPEFKKFHLVSPNNAEAFDRNSRHRSLSYDSQMGRKQVEILKAKRVSVPGSESPKTDTPDKGTVEEEDKSFGI